MTNTLSPGDKIIAPLMGQFCVIWINLMKRLHFEVDEIDCEWGEGVDLAILKQKLQADHAHAVKAVCVVHNETSTGVTNDLVAIRKALGKLFLLPSTRTTSRDHRCERLWQKQSAP